MNGIKFLMALVAACILIIPAFSMPDHGMGLDCKQKSCDCQQNMMGQDNKEKMWQGQDDNKEKMWQGQDENKKPCGCPESMMGQDNKERMWQGQDENKKPCGCPESMMGQDNKERMWQGQDDKQKKMCDDMKPRMEQDGKQMWQGHDEDHIKSMMGPECDQIGHKHIKSMMGDREKGDNGGIKVVIVNLRV